jgi:chromodomain-helicase-DNA-binding protein 1
VQKIEQVLDHRIGDTGEVEYLIKWSGWSHVHNTWNTEAALSEFGGERILQNYIKKSQHDQAARAHMLAEDLEALDIERQMQLDQLEEFKEVERVIEQSEGDEELSFLCKWRHLPYDEATWEARAWCRRAFVPAPLRLSIVLDFCTPHSSSR